MECFTGEALVSGLIAGSVVLGVLLIVWAFSSVEVTIERTTIGHGEEGGDVDEE